LGAAIHGYASATSINRGESISLHVSTTAPAYDVALYRMGVKASMTSWWVGGAGMVARSIL
jgi:hypothetical protein